MVAGVFGGKKRPIHYCAMCHNGVGAEFGPMFGASLRHGIGAVLCRDCNESGSYQVPKPNGFIVGHFDNPPLNDVLCAEDVRAARLDRDGFGRIHPEIKYAVALQVLRSIATEQIGASATVKALAAATLEVICP